MSKEDHTTFKKNDAREEGDALQWIGCSTSQGGCRTLADISIEATSITGFEAKTLRTKKKKKPHRFLVCMKGFVEILSFQGAVEHEAEVGIPKNH